MFAGILRSQARLALTLCRARTFTVGANLHPTRALALPTPFTSGLRLLSTSKPLWDERTPALQKKNLYVGNLPFSVGEDEVREVFARFGEVASIRISLNPQGTSRGFAHVEYATEEDAANAVQSAAVEPLYIMDRNLRVDFALERRPGGREREPSNTLYFHGYHGNADSLRQATRSFESSIIDIRFLRDRDTGEANGAGFIHFTSIDHATQALSELHGAEISDSESLFLRYATPSKNNTGGSGRRDGRNDSRRGRGERRY